MGRMKLTLTFLYLIFTHLLLVAQPEPFAWCIVPFDKMERTPEQRIEMLKELGINTYAYDWREKHLNEMVREFGLARANNISINAVWMWLEPGSDALDKLSPANEQVFQAIEKAGLETTLWVSFHPDFFKDLDNEVAVQRGAEMVFAVYQRCARVGCKLALYNHGDWFGDPANQIRIIKTLGRYDIGLVYSFHHAHDQIEKFEKLAKMMVPYLVAVNLNGMKRGGPQILPLGHGDYEAKMIKILTDAGYKGPYGILGHKEEADVKMILEENLTGYHRLFSKK